jgi:hypothetical protein
MPATAAEFVEWVWEYAEEKTAAEIRTKRQILMV